MKNIVLSHDLLRSLKIMCTFDEKTLESCLRAQAGYTYKFIVLQEDELRLIIAPVLNYVELYSAYCVRELALGTAAESARAIEKQYWESGRNPGVIGTGMIHGAGAVTNWKSTSFRIETPHYMRSEIEAEVRSLHLSGALISSESLIY